MAGVRAWACLAHEAGAHALDVGGEDAVRDAELRAQEVRAALLAQRRLYVPNTGHHVAKIISRS